MLSEVQVRDEVDFAAWVSARGDALQRFAFLVTGDAADAPDLVQDALSRAYPRWRSLASSGTAEAYVRKSIVNGSVSRWRKRRRLTAVEDVEPYTEPADDPTDAYGDADLAPIWRGNCAGRCRPGNARRWCCATTRTCRSGRSR